MNMTKQLPYPPPFQDIALLAQHLSVSESTVENWVRQGFLPPPRKVGGKRLWLWREVMEWLERSPDIPVDELERIRHATKKALTKD